MDFAFDARTEEPRQRLLAFLDTHVYPAEPVVREQREQLASPWATPPAVEELKAEARRQGLWNLFLPDLEYGAGLTNLQYAPSSQDTPLAELWAGARTLRLADGPDEVHQRSLARRELRKYQVDA